MKFTNQLHEKKSHHMCSVMRGKHTQVKALRKVINDNKDACMVGIRQKTHDEIHRQILPRLSWHK